MVKNTFTMTDLALAFALAFSAATAVASEAPGVLPATSSAAAGSVDDAVQVPPITGALTSVHQPVEAPVWEVKTEQVTATAVAGVAAPATLVAVVGPEAGVAAFYDSGEGPAPRELAAEDIEVINGQWSIRNVGKTISKAVNDVGKAASDVGHGISVTGKDAGHALYVNARNAPDALDEAMKKAGVAVVAIGNVTRVVGEWVACVEAGVVSCGVALADTVKTYKQYRHAIVIDAARIAHQTCVAKNHSSGGCGHTLTSYTAKYEKKLPKV